MAKVWQIVVLCLMAAFLLGGHSFQQKEGEGKEEKKGGGAARPTADGEIKCGKEELVWQGANNKPADVEMEYWATGSCRANFTPGGGPTSGEHTADAKSTDKDVKSHSFKNVTTLTFHCIEGEVKGACFYRIVRAGADHGGPGTKKELMHCRSERDEQPRTIVAASSSSSAMLP